MKFVRLTIGGDILRYLVPVEREGLARVYSHIVKRHIPSYFSVLLLPPYRIEAELLQRLRDENKSAYADVERCLRLFYNLSSNECFDDIYEDWCEEFFSLLSLIGGHLVYGGCDRFDFSVTIIPLNVVV